MFEQPQPPQQSVPPVQPLPPEQPKPPYTPPRELYEKDEKDEKDEEKRPQQHEKDEKSWDEKWRRDPVEAAGWAVFLIWIGIVFLAENMSVDLGPWTGDVGRLILAGAGVIILVQVLIRVLFPAYRRPVIGSLIFGLILLTLGLGAMSSWDVIWPIIVIVVGVAILAGALLRRR
jgi:hypothetical protein